MRYGCTMRRRCEPSSVLTAGRHNDVARQASYLTGHDTKSALRMAIRPGLSDELFHRLNDVLRTDAARIEKLGRRARTGQLGDAE
jgi:hypothetical protein